MKERLDKLLSNRGYGSRSEMQRVIRDGRVSVSGTAVSDPSTKAEASSVTIDGASISEERFLYLIMNKPAGYICSHDETGPTVYELLDATLQRLSPKLTTVGRLDKDTEGLLLLTNDGDFVHVLTSPRTHVPKVYEATLEEPLNGSEAALFASGTLVLRDEEKPLAPAALEVLAPTHARLTIGEGRYHQVRRMFAAVNNHVISLRRIAIGSLTLGALGAGEWRELTVAERESLVATPHRPSK